MFKTKDFYLAATLIDEQYEIQDHQIEDGKTIFFFEDTPELRQTVQNYFYDQLTVTPHQFQMAIKTAKSIIYAQQQ